MVVWWSERRVTFDLRLAKVQYANEEEGREREAAATPPSMRKGDPMMAASHAHMPRTTLLMRTFTS